MKITSKQLSALFYGALACENQADMLEKNNEPWSIQLREYAKELHAMFDNVENRANARAIREDRQDNAPQRD